MAGQLQSERVVKRTRFDGDLSRPTFAFMKDPAAATGTKITIDLSAAVSSLSIAAKLAINGQICRIYGQRDAKRA
ncbi:MAG: hypothetical protein O3C52_09515 [Proteobacteria bacterium]|nr:hypothetical protein [Pseudomonadota bacterium]MDA1033585.1 hypothetical protein [Pseudomonadota bacterium]